MHLPRLRSCERYSESPSDDVVAFDYLMEEEEYGSYTLGTEATTWGPSQRSGSVRWLLSTDIVSCVTSQALEALLSAAASAATQLQDEHSNRQPSPPPRPPTRDLYPRAEALQVRT